jgi:hypothetical protein
VTEDGWNELECRSRATGSTSQQRSSERLPIDRLGHSTLLAVMQAKGSDHLGGGTMRRTTSAPPSGPFSIADDSRMSEDYLLTDDVLVDASSSNPLAAARTADGRWTALAVVPGRGLVHVVPDQSSQSGWDLLPMPSGAAAAEVVAGLDGTQTSHAFYQDGAHTYHSSLGADGTWSAPDKLPASASLAVANVPLTNEAVAAGITPEGTSC